jgi:hypothetical protein
MSTQNRTFSIQVLVNAAERKELLKAAERNAMPTIAGYVRAKALIAARAEARLEQQIERRLETLTEA